MCACMYEGMYECMHVCMYECMSVCMNECVYSYCMYIDRIPMTRAGILQKKKLQSFAVGGIFCKRLLETFGSGRSEIEFKIVASLLTRGGGEEEEERRRRRGGGDVTIIRRT